MWESNKSSGVDLPVGETASAALKSLLVSSYTGDLVDVVKGDVVMGLIELAHRFRLVSPFYYVCSYALTCDVTLTHTHSCTVSKVCILFILIVSSP